MSQKLYKPGLLLLLIVIIAVIPTLGWNFIKNSPKQEVTTNFSLPTTQELAKDLSQEQTPIGNDLKKQILEDITNNGILCNFKDENGNIENRCTVDAVSGYYAKGNMPQAYWIAEKVNGIWKVELTGNGIPLCSEIDKYSIPQDLYGKCIDSEGGIRN